MYSRPPIAQIETPQISWIRQIVDEVLLSLPQAKMKLKCILTARANFRRPKSAS